MTPCLVSSIRVGVLLTAFSLLVTVRPAQGDEKKNRAQALEKELAHLRDSLHDAQRELAKKNDRIEELEKQLVAAKACPKEEGERKRKAPEARKPNKNRAEKKSEPETAAKPAPKAPPAKAPEAKPQQPVKPQPAKAAAAPAPQVAPKPQPRLFTVSYEKNSAANLKQREAALVWARQQLKSKPGLGLKIVGSANDSEYPEANREIATNRARFLADYFVASGVPREAILATEGTVAKTKADAGRTALIQVVERPTQARK
mgnify:CR=1 FL=1